MLSGMGLSARRSGGYSGLIPAAAHAYHPRRFKVNRRTSRTMQPPEVIEVDKDRIGCDGGEGALGHPLVYLTLDTSGKVDCPYCGRLFIRRAGAKAGEAH
jgi:uncharacterized Zn-finger protein